MSLDLLNYFSPQKDNELFEVLFREYYSFLFYSIQKNYSDLSNEANDIISTVYCIAIHYREKILSADDVRRRKLLQLYLKSTCCNMLRRKRKAESIFISGEVPEIASPDRDLAETVIIKIDGKRAMELLNTLPEPSRSVLQLKYIDDLSTREIADKLGLTETNVSTIHTRAIKKLRKLMGVDYNG